MDFRIFPNDEVEAIALEFAKKAIADNCKPELALEIFIRTKSELYKIQGSVYERIN